MWLDAHIDGSDVDAQTIVVERRVVVNVIVAMTLLHEKSIRGDNSVASSLVRTMVLFGSNDGATAGRAT